MKEVLSMMDSLTIKSQKCVFPDDKNFAFNAIEGIDAHFFCNKNKNLLLQRLRKY